MSRDAVIYSGDFGEVVGSASKQKHSEKKEKTNEQELVENRNKYWKRLAEISWEKLSKLTKKKSTSSS